MKENKGPVYVTIIILTFFLFSCRHEPLLSPDSPTVCFQDQVLPLIRSNCAIPGCHDAGSGEAPALTDFDNISQYVTPEKPNQSKLYKVTITTSVLVEFMPPSPQDPLKQNQIDLISIWILQGAINNSCECDTSKYNYSADIAPIIEYYCSGCHSGTNPQGGISLTTKEQVKVYGAIPAGMPGSLLGAITHDPNNFPMPKNDVPLSDCKITQITNWIQHGMQ